MSGNVSLLHFFLKRPLNLPAQAITFDVSILIPLQYSTLSILHFNSIIHLHAENWTVWLVGSSKAKKKKNSKTAGIYLFNGLFDTVIKPITHKIWNVLFFIEFWTTKCVNKKKKRKENQQQKWNFIHSFFFFKKISAFPLVHKPFPNWDKQNMINSEKLEGH